MWCFARQAGKTGRKATASYGNIFASYLSFSESGAFLAFVSSRYFLVPTGPSKSSVF